MRNVKNLKDVQIVLNEILNWKQNMETNELDMKKRRIRNLAPALEDSDAINLAQVKELISKSK